MPRLPRPRDLAEAVYHCALAVVLDVLGLMTKEKR